VANAYLNVPHLCVVQQLQKMYVAQDRAGLQNCHKAVYFEHSLTLKAEIGLGSFSCTATLFLWAEDVDFCETQLNVSSFARLRKAADELAVGK